MGGNARLAARSAATDSTVRGRPFFRKSQSPKCQQRWVGGGVGLMRESRSQWGGLDVNRPALRQPPWVRRGSLFHKTPKCFFRLVELFDHRMIRSANESEFHAKKRRLRWGVCRLGPQPRAAAFCPKVVSAEASTAEARRGGAWRGVESGAAWVPSAVAGAAIRDRCGVSEGSL